MLGAALIALEARAVSGLVVCPTPIGNLEDVTLRVLSALREADLVACEDTRRTRTLLDRYGVSAKLVSYHEHNEEARAAELVERMRDGQTVALVSDAGMPLVSDPGYVLVRACVAAGLPVEVLPGPSAAIAALVASALPADRWRFAGLLPAQEGRAAGAARGAGRDAGGVRVAAAGAGHAGAGGRGGPGARGGRLPRADQGPRGGGARERRRSWRSATRAAPPKGEVVLVLGPAAEPGAGDGPPAGLDQLRRLVEAGREAARGGEGGGRAHGGPRERRSTARSPSDGSPRSVTAA